MVVVLVLVLVVCKSGVAMLNACITAMMMMRKGK